jgi:argininosuccinate lyase
VRQALDRGLTLAQLPLSDLRAEHEAFAEDVYAALDPETAIERRNLPGGPARAMVGNELQTFRLRFAERQLDVERICERYAAKTPA